MDKLPQFFDATLVHIYNEKWFKKETAPKR